MDEDDIERRLRTAERTIAALAVTCDAQGRILDALLVEAVRQRPIPKHTLDTLFESVMAHLDLWKEPDGRTAKREAVRRYCEKIFSLYSQQIPSQEDDGQKR